MVRESLGLTSAKELIGKSVCTDQGTTTELNLASYFRANGLTYQPVSFANATEKAYEAGRCDATTTDVSGLYAARLSLSNPDDHVILPEVLSKEPLGPAVRHGDNQWADIVRWTFNAMLDAEELGVTNDWAVRIIKHVDNSGESFERNVGEGSPLKIKRGQNAQWTKGDLQYGIPTR